MTVTVVDYQVEHQMTIAVMQKGELMSDLISRQDAIKALRRAKALTFAFGYHNVIDTIIELPSAGVQKTAQNISPEDFLCSRCSFGDFGGFRGYKPRYCPNCGARMVGEKE